MKRRIKGTEFNVLVETEDQVELSFSRTWDASHRNLAPLGVDKRSCTNGLLALTTTIFKKMAPNIIMTVTELQKLYVTGL